MSLLLLPVRQPLLPMAAVCAVLGKLPREVGKLIDCGALQFVFNIQAGAGSRQCLRILADSVADHLNARTELKTFEQVFTRILPGASERVPAAVLARLFCCSTEHVTSLFHVAHPGRRGPTSSPGVPRREVAELLKRRRVL
jgi:hypothetical protein